MSTREGVGQLAKVISQRDTIERLKVPATCAEPLVLASGHAQFKQVRVIIVPYACNYTYSNYNT